MGRDTQKQRKKVKNVRECNIPKLARLIAVDWNQMWRQSDVIWPDLEGPDGLKGNGEKKELSAFCFLHVLLIQSLKRDISSFYLAEIVLSQHCFIFYWMSNQLSMLNSLYAQVHATFLKKQFCHLRTLMPFQLCSTYFLPWNKQKKCYNV